MDGPAGPKLRALPSVGSLLDRPEAACLDALHGRAALTAALRTALGEARLAITHGHVPAPPLERAAEILGKTASSRLRPVINATGIVLHTNLGRAPLAEEALAAIAEVAKGYCTLEYDLGAGTRGHRTQGIEPLIRTLTGAESAIAVNNNAAAILLALSALAPGGEVIVSRGELIEIGGGFRIPDVIVQGGARLVEVGSTNKTRLADYEAAITPATKILFKTHQSNFRMQGFTADTGLAELAVLARAHGLFVIHDLGSGLLTSPDGLDLPEPAVAHSIAQGADIVLFSGDKLMGGPQAGILAGKEAAIAPLRRHPLMRALRLDKLSLAALEATLHLHAAGQASRIPTLRMLAQTRPVLHARAEALARLLPPGACSVIATEGSPGGGTLPCHAIPSAGLAFHSPEPLAARLRAGRPPVIARIAADRLILDMLTVTDAELPALAAAVTQALPA